MGIAAGQIVTEDDLQDMQNAGFEKPVVRLIQATAQSIPDGAVDTALTFGTGSTDIDTHAFHSEVTNNTRITPTVEGVYRLHAVMMLAAVGTSAVTIGAVFSKNGTPQAPRMRIGPNNGTVVSGANAQRSIELTCILSANGTTDYFEFVGAQTTGGAKSTTVGSSYTSIFECEFVRGPE